MKKLMLGLVATVLIAFAVGGCVQQAAVAPADKAASNAPASLAGFIVETQELAGMLGQASLVVIDARAADLYKEGHIPGAINLVNVGSGAGGTSAVRDPDSAAGGLPITAEKSQRVFGSAGIDAGTRVIIYDAGDGRSASGVWFVLRAFGHDNSQVLNGGLRKWAEEKRPVNEEAVKAQQKSFIAQPKSDLIATADWLEANKDRALVIDARTFNEFVGLDLLDNPRGGHIPGAIWLEWKDLAGKIEAGELPTFKSTAEIQKVLQVKGVGKDKTIVTYCQFGTQRASFVYLTLKMLGYENVRLYTGSYEDWSRRLNLQVLTGK